MNDNEISDDGFDRRHVGKHNAFLFRRNREAGAIIAAVKQRQATETDFRVGGVGR